LRGKVRFMQGNEAIAEGAFYAGARFFAGYPITPSSEIAEIASRRLLKLGGYYLQMEDELASLAAVIGASLCGVKAFTATSGPGFSLMQENLGVAIMAEVPCVVINVQRSGPSTGLATRPAQADVMQARWGTHGDHAIIALSPASVQECFELTVRAFNFAERFRTPVILLADEIVGHMRERVVLPEAGELEVLERKRPRVPPEEYLPYQPDVDGVPPMSDFGSPYVFHATGSMHDERGLPNNSPENARRVIRRLHDKIYNHRDELTLTRGFAMEEAEYLVIAFGATARAARKALRLARERGVRVGLLQLQTLWPFPEEVVEGAAGRVRGLIVAEMNLGQIVHEVRRVVGWDRPVVSVAKSDGEGITPDEILAGLEAF